jgi:predicted nicotinamide N-methyase
VQDLVEESVPLRGAALQVLRPRDAEALLDEHAFEHEEYLPYWAELWPSGVALARRVAVRALRGARVLELGCGLGLPSLAAALAGGRVLATDWSPQAIELLERNAERNDAPLETARVDWAGPAAIVGRAPWDLVLAADVLYERRNVAPLLELIPRLIGERGELWLADPGRAPAEELLRGLEGGWERRDEADGRVTVHRLVRAPAVVSAQ